MRGGIFRVACLGGCVERVMDKEIVYTCCLFKMVCCSVGEQLGALKSGVGDCFDVAGFIGFACLVSLEISA